MKIELLSHKEHTRLREQEPALKQNKQRYSYEHWSDARTALVKVLRIHGKPDSTGYGGGDFFVGEDWFEHGGLHAVLLNWGTLKAEFVSSCVRFLVDGHNEFLVTVGKSLSAADDYDFEIVITASRCYMSFFEKEAAEGRNIVQTDERFDLLKPLLVSSRPK